jgi:dienelactone hydrolase
VGFAADAILRRGGARGALFLYGSIDPAWWDVPWPDGVPAQSHQTQDDPWREVEADDAYQANEVGDFFLYPGSGHLFLETGHRQFEPAAAEVATARILDFLAGLD